MNKITIKFGFLLFILFIVSDVIAQTEKPVNDTGILSDIWSSLTSVGKAPACPGECVHAITSIFCDNVLEEVTCGATFLRCCVPHEFSFGTPVETSAPISDTSNDNPVVSQAEEHTTLRPVSIATPSTTTTTTTTTTPRPTNPHSITSFPLMIRPHNHKPYTPAVVFGSVNVNKFDPMLLSSTTTTTTTTTTTPKPSTSSLKPVEADLQTNKKKDVITPMPLCEGTCVVSLFSLLCNQTDDSLYCPNGGTCCVNRASAPETVTPKPCPGVCIQRKYNRFCSNILNDAKCSGEDYQCCLQSDVDFDNSTSVVTLVQQSDSANASKEYTKLDTMPTSVSYGKDSVATTPTMPLCEGTCVAPLFSLLCDETDYSLYCPNGGSCCVNRDPTTTTEAPQVKPCPGNCIPTILSGMCNRPSKLIVNTLDCTSGSICCTNPHQTNDDNEDDTNVPKFNIPLQPPGVPPNIPQNYNSMPFPSENAWPPMHGPELPIQRPHINKMPPFPMIPPPVRHSPQNIQTNSQLVPNRDMVAMPSRPSPLPSLPQPELDHPIDKDSVDNTSTSISGVGGPPFCPGPCIAPMFRFTCFGGNSIYPKFQCAKSGQICCAPMTDIETFEANVVANNGIWKADHNKTVNYDDSPIKPLPPRKPNPYMCGIKGTQRQESPRVVGGSDAYPGEWCWQIALINAQNQYLCGGALISSQWVLSAAHCITNLVRSGETIYVRVGDHDLTSQLGSRGAQTQKVVTTYIHHNHNGQTLDNDIALLKLQSPVELNDAVCLVCLPARGSKRKPGKKCTVTGYGYKDETGPIALKVREAEVPVVDDQECTVRVNSVTEKLFILPASSFCAGGEDGNDACQGDGGSGLVCENEGFYELTGLVSWGFGCGRSGVPGVYVKVSAFVGWINQIISVNNQ